MKDIILQDKFDIRNIAFQRKIVEYMRKESNYDNDYLLQHTYFLRNYYISKAIYRIPLKISTL